jgi:hypothetical protein
MLQLHGMIKQKLEQGTEYILKHGLSVALMEPRQVGKTTIALMLSVFLLGSTLDARHRL